MATVLSLVAGRDGPDRRALPMGEFLHPVPLAALALLAANDWWLKGAGLLPGVLTGKLSDFAGVVFFPVLVTAAVGVLRYAARRSGADIDPSLTSQRLAGAVWATGALMVALKTLPAAATAFEAAFAAVGVQARVAVDPTDLVCLPALALPWWVGRQHVARLPLGRLEVLLDRTERWRFCSGDELEVELSDLIACGADPAEVSELAHAIAGFADARSNADARARLERALNKLR